MSTKKPDQQTLSQPATFSTQAALVYLMAPGLNGREGIPACVWGPPGGGKSTQIRALAQSLGFHVETVILSNREPSEVCGSPIPQRQENGEVIITYAKPLWARRVIEKVAKGIPCLVFLDELTTCPPNTQAPALRLVNEGQAPDWEMPAEVRWFCAANPPECSAGGQELTPPMANRMGHFQAVATQGKEFSEWLQSNGGDRNHLNYHNSVKEQAEGLAKYQKLKELITSSWDQQFALARATIGNFVANHNDVLHRMPDPDSSEAGRAWPSPRTWEAAARIFATSKCLNSDASSTTNALAAIIGEVATTELITYANSLNLPDLHEILAGRSNFEVSPSMVDVATVVMNGLANLAAALNAREQLSPTQKRNFWKFMTTGGVGNLKDAQMRVLRRVINMGNTLFDQNIPECLACHEKLSEISKATAKHKR